MAVCDISSPIIFVGAPYSGVHLISSIVFHHTDITWLDNCFASHPHSGFHHYRFRFLCNIQKHCLLLKKTYPHNLSHAYHRKSSQALKFWQDATRDDIDFILGFAANKQASSIETSLIHETFIKRVEITKKPRLGLFFVGPSRLCFLHSLFPDAKFIHIVRDPAFVVKALINDKKWKKEGRHSLMWRGIYTKNELSTYHKIKTNPVASTAFQLSKILTNTKNEAKTGDIKLKTIRYEDFIHHPNEMIQAILSFTSLTPSNEIDRVVRQYPFRLSDNILTMPADDIHTVYQWCTSQ